jgi:hypothetical protein
LHPDLQIQITATTPSAFTWSSPPTIHETGRTNAKRKAGIRKQERRFKPCQKDNKGQNLVSAAPECRINNCRRGMP